MNRSERERMSRDVLARTLDTANAHVRTYTHTHTEARASARAQHMRTDEAVRRLHVAPAMHESDATRTTRVVCCSRERVRER